MNKKKRKKKKKTKKEDSVHWLQWIRASRKINRPCPIVSLLFFCFVFFLAKHPRLTSVYLCHFKSRLGSRARFAIELWELPRSCTLRKKPPEPHIMFYSPLVSATFIRFSLCKILEKDCCSGLHQSKGHCTDVTLERLEEHETCLKSKIENKSKKLK